MVRLDYMEENTQRIERDILLNKVDEKNPNI